MTETVFFYIFSALTLLPALFILRTRSPIYGTLALLLSMFGLAALFLLLQATFLAVIQIVVYAGAIVVLFLFAIMLFGINQREKVKRGFFFQLITLLTGGALLFLLIRAVYSARSLFNQSAVNLEGSVKALGHLIFSTYLLPFELISLLILVAVIGAVYLAKSE